MEAGEGDITDQRRDFCGGSERRAERVVGRGTEGDALSPLRLVSLGGRPFLYRDGGSLPPLSPGFVSPLFFYLPATYLPFPHLRDIACRGRLRAAPC